MKTSLTKLLPLVLIGILAGCSKAPETPAAPPPVTVTVVPANQRSSHFLAVQQHLDLGGTLYGYADVDGDAQKVGVYLNSLLGLIASTQPNARQLKQDYPALLQKLGLTDIQAIGLSSVPDGTGYFQNKVFIYAPGPRHGLLAGLGGAPTAFDRVVRAPANADFYAESEMDLPQVYKTVKEVVDQVTGEQKAGSKMDGQLTAVGKMVAWPFLDLIQHWKGQVSMTIRLDPTKTIQLPPGQGAFIPSPSIVISVEGIGPFIDQGLSHSPVFSSRKEGTLKVFELKAPVPVEGLKPVIVIDGTTAYVATTFAFLQECLAPKAGLAQDAAFKAALAHLGSTGNGLTYVSPSFFRQLHRIQELNPQLPPQVQQTMQLWMSQIPKIDRPVVAIRSNLPDGILIRSYWNRSLKQDVAVAAVYNPITIGIMAAIAVPAFQKVRVASQEKAVMNNLRMLSAAADQYYLEHGVDTATYNDLVGSDKYVKAITSVAGEDYRGLAFKQGVPLRLYIPGLHKIMTYAP